MDQAYMDGHEQQQPSQSSKAGRILRFRQNTLGRIEWPQYDELSSYTGGTADPTMDNFNLTDSCQLRAAMCCFPMRNTATVGTNLFDGGAIANSQICTNDLSDNRKSHHIHRGYAVYNNQDNNAYCTGFSWDASPDSTSNRYKGNSLMDIAYGIISSSNNMFMEHDASGRGSASSTPLCGCVEKMPTVTNAHCRNAHVQNEAFSLIISDTNGLSIQQTSGTVSFTDCGNNLVASYQGNAEEREQLEKHITGGSCAVTQSNFWNQRMYASAANAIDNGNHLIGRRYTKPDPAQWTQFAGMGLSHFPVRTFNLTTDSEDEFRTLLGTWPNYKLLYRHCESCLPSHQHIYYKRITPFPPNFYLLELFLDNWVSENNELGIDFLLFDTYENAAGSGINGNWTYCNYDGSVGFPRDCSPSRYVPCQWNSVTRRPCNTDYSAKSWGFYVEK